MLFEPLEERRLLAWGAFPILIGQDQAVAKHPTITGAGTSIAFLDTGINYNDPALGGGFGPGHKVIAGYDFVDNDSDPMDTDGHGTGLASIAGASTYSFNGASYQGVAPGANLIDLRIDDGTFGWNKEAANSELALQWVISHRDQYNIVSVNMSFGRAHYSEATTLAPIADELATLNKMGVLLVASSGNDGAQSPFGVEYPAADPNVYAVGSINSSDVISTFTERGALMDILAPGENVPLIYYLPKTKSRDILAGSGTSFSAPYIAATAALLKQIDPTLTPAQMMSIMQRSGSSNFDGDKEASPNTKLTWQRLNINNALNMAIAQRAVGTVPTGAHASSSAIAYDSAGNLHLAFYDESSKNLKYAKRSAAGVWGNTTVVDAGFMVGQFVSLAIDSSNHPGIAYYDANKADLKYAHFNGSSWAVSTVDSTFTTGYYPSLQYDASGAPIISYYYKTGADLKFAVFQSGKWVLSTIDSANDVGRYSSLALNPATGRWSLAYEDTTHGWFKYADQTKNGWSPTVVDSTTRIGGGYISLAFNPHNSSRPAFSYYDAYNGDLKFASFNGSSWSKQTVATKGTVGLYSNLVIDPGTGDLDILYYGKNSDSVLRAVSSGASWSLAQITTDGGRWISRALDTDETQTLSYLRSDGLRIINL